MDKNISINRTNKEITKIDIPTFLIHGLGSNSLAMITLETKLMSEGFINVFSLDYNPEYNFNTVLSNISQMIDSRLKMINKSKEDEIILIGQSYGGLISNNLHKLGYNINIGIYIVSPLRSARILNFAENILPENISKEFKKKSYEILMDESQDIFNIVPPHPYITIGATWGLSNYMMSKISKLLPDFKPSENTYFDGCVFEDECKLEEEHHRTFSFWDHRSIFVCPTMINYVYKTIMSTSDLA